MLTNVMRNWADLVRKFVRLHTCTAALTYKILIVFHVLQACGAHAHAVGGLL